METFENDWIAGKVTDFELRHDDYIYWWTTVATPIPSVSQSPHRFVVMHLFDDDEDLIKLIAECFVEDGKTKIERIAFSGVWKSKIKEVHTVQDLVSVHGSLNTRIPFQFVFGDRESVHPVDYTYHSGKRWRDPDAMLELFEQGIDERWKLHQLH